MSPSALNLILAFFAGLVGAIVAAAAGGPGWTVSCMFFLSFLIVRDR